MVKSVTRIILSSSLILPLFLNATPFSPQKGFRFDTPWLGVMVKDVSEKTLKNMDLENGVLVAKVYKDSPADEAGLEIDDILISFAGKKISNSKELVENVKNSKVNDEVTIQYLRNGKKESTTAKIKKRKAPQVFMKKMPQIMKKELHHSHHSVFLGVKVEGLSSQLRQYFGVDEDFGVLISEVVKESPAEKAGLKAGDVIIKVADREVKNYNDLIRGLNYFDPDDEVEIVIIRNKTKKSIPVKLTKPESSPSPLMWFDEDMKDYDIDVDVDVPEIKELHDEDIDLRLDDLNKKIKIRKKIIKENEANLGKFQKLFS